MKRVPIRRVTPMKRGGTIKPKRRRSTEFARIYGSRKRVLWVKSLGCVYCTILSPVFAYATAGASHNAHTETGGTGRKAGFETIIPLCAAHHRRYDQHETPFDDERVRAAMKAASTEVQNRWLTRTRGAEP